LSLAELEAVRMILRGGSVIDWYRLNFESLDDARALIRLLGGDPDDARDLRRLEHLRDRAGAYLQEQMGYRVSEELLSCPPLDLFLHASELRGRRRDRFFACLLLKAMHIYNHIEARELRYRLPLAQSRIAGWVVSRVDAFARGLEEEDFPLVSYEGGEKELASLVTKLLVKREHHAAAIHDRVRFRFIVERPSDLVPLLHRLSSRLLPFPYVVPGETVNHLVNFTALIESHEAYRVHADDFQVELGHEEQALQQVNEFSGPTYRVINFVVDVPVRVPDEALSSVPEHDELGRVVFSLAEFQVVDRTSAAENDAGDNRHDRYKQRKLGTVRDRLERGLRGDRLESDDKV
jgi:uncharacterized protein (TIGR04552 family)